MPGGPWAPGEYWGHHREGDYLVMTNNYKEPMRYYANNIRNIQPEPKWTGYIVVTKCSGGDIRALHLPGLCSESTSPDRLLINQWVKEHDPELVSLETLIKARYRLYENAHRWIWMGPDDFHDAYRMASQHYRKAKGAER